MSIKVPNDYSSMADILKDLKDMADSIEKEFARKDDITNINVPTKTSELKNDSNFVKDENYIHTDNNFTTEEKEKLESLENYNDTKTKKDISDIKTEQIAQNETIQANSNDITANTEEIARLQEENQTIKSQIPSRRSRRRNYNIKGQ